MQHFFVTDVIQKFEFLKKDYHQKVDSKSFNLAFVLPKSDLKRKSYEQNKLTQGTLDIRMFFNFLGA